MKILPLLLLGVLVQGDPCTCGSCFIPHVQVVGTCHGCKKSVSSASHKLCDACADAKGACHHCTKVRGTLHVFIGTAALVDKQPRADLEYVVCTPESGESQGLYRNRAVPKEYAPGVRALIVTSKAGQGDHHLRNFIPLAPKEKDLEVTGESDKPVYWRIGILVGPETAPKDGKFRLKLPPVKAIPVEVVSGDKVLSRHYFDWDLWMPH